MKTNEKLVDVTGIEPATPCLQSIGLDSLRSIHYPQLLTFPTNRGTCFSLKAIPNGIKTLDSCTARAQRLLTEIPGVNPS
jgi:hypothetical protein